MPGGRTRTLAIVLAGGAGMAFVRLRDVSALYAEFLASGVVPLVPLPRSELRPAERVREELQAKWAAGESIARMGEIADQPWGIRESPLLDANNNLVRSAHPCMKWTPSQR